MHSAPIEEAYRKQMNDIATLIDGAISETTPVGKKTGFVLLVFEFGEPTELSRMNYISNAERTDMLVALKELLANFEGRMMPDAKGQ